MACVHIITGIQGTGKTLYLSYLVQLLANNQSVINNCHSLIDCYNAKGFNFSKPDIPIFADTEFEIHRLFNAPTTTYFVSGYHLGLPHWVVREDKKNHNSIVRYRTMLLPPGVKILLDEGNKYFDSKDDDLMPGWRTRWIELMRHFDQELYLVAHRPFMVSKRVRDYADYMLFLKTNFRYDEKDKISCIEFQYRRFDTFQEMEAYLKSGKLPLGNEIESLKIDCSLPCNKIYKYYDTKFFDKMFLEGVKDCDFDLVRKNTYCNSPEDINLFCKQYNYKVPKEIYIK